MIQLTQDEIQYLQRSTDNLFAALKALFHEPSDANVQEVANVVFNIKSAGYEPSFVRNPLKVIVKRPQEEVVTTVTPEEVQAKRDAIRHMFSEREVK